MITRLDRVWEAELVHGSKARVLQVHLGFIEHKEEEINTVCEPQI